MYHFLSPVDFFQNQQLLSFFQGIHVQGIIRVTNGLDPDQDQHFVEPDLGSNCLQRLSADGIGRQRVNSFKNKAAY